MPLLRHSFLFSFTIIIISFVACNSNLQKDPLIATYVDNSPSNDDDGGGTLLFKNLIKQNTNNVLSLSKFAGTSSHKLEIVNVNDYGAKGDGYTDDTQAFKKAWKEACSSRESVFVAPQDNNYLLKPIRFSGPCKSNITVQIFGDLEASDELSDYKDDKRHWLVFDSVEKLLVNGGGTINGKGNIWWQNSCKRNKKKPCKDAPTALTFYNCEELIVQNLKIENAQQIHVSFQDSNNVTVFGLNISSPEDSPNTDGIHVTNTQNIKISSCVIGTGDDCISIVHGSRNVEATNITCGPGHGISIGSLGAGKSKEFVSGVIVNGSKISGTKNGVRIKTWPNSAVQISDVLYENIIGTSASDVAVKFDCSKKFPCKDIVMKNIDLQYEEDGEAAKALCDNVDLSYTGHVMPRCHS